VLTVSAPAWHEALRAQGWKKLGPFNIWVYKKPITTEYVVTGDGTAYPITENATTLNYVILTVGKRAKLYGGGRFPSSWGRQRRYFSPICFGTHDRNPEHVVTLLEMLKNVRSYDVFECDIEYDADHPIKPLLVGELW